MLYKKYKYGFYEQFLSINDLAMFQKNSLHAINSGVISKNNDNWSQQLDKFISMNSDTKAYENYKNMSPTYFKRLMKSQTLNLNMDSVSVGLKGIVKDTDFKLRFFGINDLIVLSSDIKWMNAFAFILISKSFDMVPTIATSLMSIKNIKVRIKNSIRTKIITIYNNENIWTNISDYSAKGIGSIDVNDVNNGLVGVFDQRFIYYKIDNNFNLSNIAYLSNVPNPPNEIPVIWEYQANKNNESSKTIESNSEENTIILTPQKITCQIFEITPNNNYNVDIELNITIDSMELYDYIMKSNLNFWNAFNILEIDRNWLTPKTFTNLKYLQSLNYFTNANTAKIDLYFKLMLYVNKLGKMISNLRKNIKSIMNNQSLKSKTLLKLIFMQLKLSKYNTTSFNEINEIIYKGLVVFKDLKLDQSDIIINSYLIINKESRSKLLVLLNDLIKSIISSDDFYTNPILKHNFVTTILSIDEMLNIQKFDSVTYFRNINSVKYKIIPKNNVVFIRDTVQYERSDAIDNAVSTATTQMRANPIMSEGLSNLKENTTENYRKKAYLIQSLLLNETEILNQSKKISELNEVKMKQNRNNANNPNWIELKLDELVETDIISYENGNYVVKRVLMEKEMEKKYKKLNLNTNLIRMHRKEEEQQVINNYEIDTLNVGSNLAYATSPKSDLNYQSLLMKELPIHNLVGTKYVTTGETLSVYDKLMRATDLNSVVLVLSDATNYRTAMYLQDVIIRDNDRYLIADNILEEDISYIYNVINNLSVFGTNYDELINLINNSHLVNEMSTLMGGKNKYDVSYLMMKLLTFKKNYILNLSEMYSVIIGINPALNGSASYFFGNYILQSLARNGSIGIINVKSNMNFFDPILANFSNPTSTSSSNLSVCYIYEIMLIIKSMIKYINTYDVNIEEMYIKKLLNVMYTFSPGYKAIGGDILHRKLKKFYNNFVLNTIDTTNQPIINSLNGFNWQQIFNNASVDVSTWPISNIVNAIMIDRITYHHPHEENKFYPTIQPSGAYIITNPYLPNVIHGPINYFITKGSVIANTLNNNVSHVLEKVHWSQNNYSLWTAFYLSYCMNYLMRKIVASPNNPATSIRLYNPAIATTNAIYFPHIIQTLVDNVTTHVVPNHYPINYVLQPRFVVDDIFLNCLQLHFHATAIGGQDIDLSSVLNSAIMLVDNLFNGYIVYYCFSTDGRSLSFIKPITYDFVRGLKFIDETYNSYQPMHGVNPDATRNIIIIQSSVSFVFHDLPHIFKITNDLYGFTRLVSVPFEGMTTEYFINIASRMDTSGLVSEVNMYDMFLAIQATITNNITGLIINPFAYDAVNNRCLIDMFGPLFMSLTTYINKELYAAVPNEFHLFHETAKVMQHVNYKVDN